MLAVQHRLPLALAARVRNCCRPFRPSPGQGPYRLPHDVRDRLVLTLAPFRNRDAALTLAVFLARFWSVPGRVAGSFPIDRRALTDHEGLELTEARVRGAIKTLEAVGFLERATPPCGSRYKATEDGLHRKPILFMFGPEYARAFLAANARVRAARGSDRRARRPITPAASPRLPTALPEASLTNSPKSRIQAEPKVIMGEILKRSGLPAQPSQDSALERALQRLGEAISKPRGGEA